MDGPDLIFVIPTYRRVFEERLDAARMARDYMKVYRALR